jgi:hypothetical protein
MDRNAFSLHNRINSGNGQQRDKKPENPQDRHNQKVATHARGNGHRPKKSAKTNRVNR